RELDSVGARVLVVGPTASSAVKDIDRSSLPGLEHVVAARPEDVEGATALDELLAAEPVDVVDCSEDDLVTLIFTSGTAGRPKAAMLSHGNLLANLEQCRALPGGTQEPGDVVLG